MLRAARSPGGRGGQVWPVQRELADPHAAHPVGAEGFVRLGGHGAEVLADHRGAGPVGLQAERRHEFLGGVAQIDALGGRPAGGDAEQSLKRHDVIDAQHFRVPEMRPENRPPVLVPAGAYALGMRRRGGPVLSTLEERVGRRADIEPAHESIAKPPRIEARRHARPPAGPDKAPNRVHGGRSARAESCRSSSHCT